MAEEPRQIFRRKSLEQLESPDRMDQLLRVIGPQAWIALLASAAILALAVVWSVIGRVQETVDGAAFLVRPQQIVGFQALAGGQLAEIHVEVGDRVGRGQLLAELKLPDLDNQIAQEELRLEQVRQLAAAMRGLEEELAELDRKLLDNQHEMITERIATIGTDALELKQSTEDSITRQRQYLEKSDTVASQLLEELKELSDKIGYLEGKEYASLLEGIEARTRRGELELRIDEIAAGTEELDLQAITAKDAYDRRVDTIKDLEIRLQQIELERHAIRRRLEARQIEDQSREQEVQRNIDYLRRRRDQERNVLSEYDGLVLEVTAFKGDRVDLGTRLGKIAIEDPAAELKAVAYFRVADGKKITSGLELGRQLKVLVTPTTVQRERHGGIRGRVQSVSEFPVTTAAAAHQLGEVEIARALLGSETRIEVLIELLRDGASGELVWSSGRGPEDLRITPGTTAQVRVNVGQRAPITFVLPFLKELFGLETLTGT